MSGSLKKPCGADLRRSGIGSSQINGSGADDSCADNGTKDIHNVSGADDSYADNGTKDTHVVGADEKCGRDTEYEHKTETADAAKTGKRRILPRPARRIAFAGAYAAMIIGGKEALAVLPNVEIVTLLCAVGAFVFGSICLISVLAFVTVEGLIYGFGTWIVSYYIYWPLVCLVFLLLARLIRPDNGVAMRTIPTLAALLLTAFFSVLTCLVDVGLLTGLFDNFWGRFAVYYARGIFFYITQFVTNLILFALLYQYMVNWLIKLKKQLVL